MNTIVPPLLDPFEQEVTLAEEPRVLSFSPRSFELSVDDLVRSWAFDLVGAIPRPLGSVREELPVGRRLLTYEASFYQVGPSVLALVTEIGEAEATHRVLELLGVGEDVRVRLNLTLHASRASAEGLAPAAAEAVRRGRALGQVRIWGSESARREEIRGTVARQVSSLGLDSRVLDRTVEEPTYHPPAGLRMALDQLPPQDLRVADLLLALLAKLPVAKAQARAPRRVAAHSDRVRRKSSIVSFHYETHRAATGVLHLRRREVEAGLERPGLVRTFNVAGLRGAARLRIRDIGGRTSAEFAGTVESVETIAEFLERNMGGRSG